MELETKYLQNLATDEVHCVIFRDGHRLSQEECNVDDVEHSAWLSKLEAEALPVEQRCGHCWPATELTKLGLIEEATEFNGTFINANTGEGLTATGLEAVQ